MTDMHHSIFNFHNVSDTLAMGGQPKIRDFQLLKQAGYELVFQLWIKEASYSIANERYHITQAGMEHISMELSFENPTLDDVKQFFELFDQYRHKKIFLHCAAGYCSSSLLFLYLIVRDGLSYDEAKQHILADWMPNDNWQEIIKQVIEQE
jgi:protein tyrosine phosphatase (PTP) superfamily phosphohydrolase (DUF442 family)